MITSATLFVGLVLGVLAGRWSVSDINEFKEAAPPTAPKDPHITVLDEFEPMWVSLPLRIPEHFPELFFLEIWFRQFRARIRTRPPRHPMKKRS